MDSVTRTCYPRRLNYRCSSKFLEGYPDRKALDEDNSPYVKDEDNSLGAKDEDNSPRVKR